MKLDIKSLNDMLHNVGRRDGIADLRLSSDGTAGLELRSGVRVFFEYFERHARLMIYSPICKLPPDKSHRLSLLETALKLNFLSRKDVGDIAFSEYFSEVMYQLPLDGEKISAERIDKAIDIVIERREAARTVLLQLSQNGMPASGHPSSKGHIQRLMRAG